MLKHDADFIRFFLYIDMCSDDVENIVQKDELIKNIAMKLKAGNNYIASSYDKTTKGFLWFYGLKELEPENCLEVINLEELNQITFYMRLGMDFETALATIRGTP